MEKSWITDELFICMANHDSSAPCDCFCSHWIFTVCQLLFHLSFLQEKAVSGLVVILVILLLYRKIESIGKISVFLWVGVLGTMAWIIFGGIAHGNFLEPIKHINDGFTMQHGFVAALGFASVKTIYSYLGYYNVCHLGGK